MQPGVYILIAFIVVIFIILISSIKIVRQATAVIVERLGKFNRVLETGIRFIIPIFEKAYPPISLKERVADFAPQPVITKDNVTMQIDTVVYFSVTDPKLFSYGVDNPIRAIENLTATTLRNLVGELELDGTLTSRDTVNSKMRVILDEATDPWGIKVNRVELKNIIPPREIQDAMEKQMKAERERRELILRAEGEKNSTILVAEGKKQAMILDAEAQKQRQILLAEADREARIRQAEGEAEAILKVQEATAEGLKRLNAAAPNDKVIAIKSLEAFEKAADGKATKIISPSDIQGLAGLATSLKALTEDDKNA